MIPQRYPRGKGGEAHLHPPALALRIRSLRRAPGGGGGCGGRKRWGQLTQRQLSQAARDWCRETPRAGELQGTPGSRPLSTNHGAGCAPGPAVRS